MAAIEIVPSSTIEFIVSGIVGILAIGAIVRGIAAGWINAKINSAKATDPLVTAMSIGWDKDQMERHVQALERIAKAVERLADEKDADTRDMFEKLLDRLEEAEPKPPEILPPRRRR